MGFNSPTFLAALDKIRAIGGILGLRPTTVTVRQIAWTGERAGVGTRTATDTVLTVAGQPPQVHRVTQRDLIRSGGLYQSGDFRIGPLTPSYGTGGVTEAMMDPAATANSDETYYILSGSNFPAAGLACERIKEEADSNLHRYVVVRALGVQNP
jgi:hypothetical protein